ncbi:hypothetical protein LCGC14_2688680, partial [marine sediment metagenome]
MQAVVAKLDPPPAVQVAAHVDPRLHLEVEIEGTPVRFMIDTGASDIVLTPRDAARIGLDVAALSFTQRYQTANGIVWRQPVTLSSLSPGQRRNLG